MVADLSAQISKFQEFFETTYKERIDELRGHYPASKSIYIDYSEFEKIEPDLADALIKEPELIIAAAEEAIKEMNLSVSVGTIFEPHVRFHNMPNEEVLIEKIGSKNIGELVCFKCVVTKRAEMMHRVKLAVYKCDLCESEMKLIVSKNFVPPKRCENCKKIALKRVEEESTYVDMQRAEVQELLERVRGGAPAAHIELLLEDDLVNRVAPGDNISVTGILRLKPPMKMRQKQEMVYSRYVEANSVTSLRKDFEELEITREDERRLVELSKDPSITEIVINSIAPSIYGHSEVKKAIALQLFGGTRGKEMKGGMPIRDDIHILLIGDPGIAKSRFLQSVTDIAPKSIYVSGKSVSGAGLTVAAERDELGEGGWTLKAGALVLASGGCAQVDEFDKIDEEDRASLHEAMETQSYHFKTKIMLSDGKEVEMGELVESYMEKNKDKVIKGHKCLILRDGIDDIKILTTDFDKIKEVRPSQISKHTAPDHFIKMVLQTGRKLLVTPEHPVWVVKDGEITTKEARHVTDKDYTLMPRHLPLRNSKEKLPQELFKFLGYHITDGGYELNRNLKNGINFYNKNDELIEDYQDTTRQLFDVPMYLRENPSSGVKSVRLISKKVFSRLDAIHPPLTGKGKDKNIPPQLLSAPSKQIKLLLRAAFDGDGTFSGHYVGIVGENEVFIEQIQLLLLRFGIRSHIFRDGKVFRLTITGKENLEGYLKEIGFLSSRKMKGLKAYLKKRGAYRNNTDVIPNCSGLVFHLLKELKLYEKHMCGYGLHSQKKGFCFTRKNFIRICKKMRKRMEIIRKEIEKIDDYDYGSLIEVRKRLNISQKDLALEVSRATIAYWEKKRNCKGRYANSIKKVLKKKLRKEDELKLLERYAFGDIGFVGVKKVEKIPNKGEKWVYDVTVEPTRSFISECTVLHNTISVAKAGIVAKFRTKTAILAAANPKYGRFDQTKNLADQFDVPPTLLSRFDLIFPIVDVLDEQKDAKLAQHILSTHMNAEVEEEQTFDKDVLRKYISYARRNVHPKLTTGASDRIREFYVDLRRKSRDAGSVAITPRYLEGLVRLAEAHAKMRLSKEVHEDDAMIAIGLFEYVMAQIMTDKETGAFDVDVVATGKPKSEREKLQKSDTVLEIIREHLRKNDTADVEQVIADAKSFDIEEGTAKKIISELLRRGVIYEKEYGHIRIVGE
jgi:replicative DNA helicase Mcm